MIFTVIMYYAYVGLIDFVFFFFLSFFDDTNEYKIHTEIKNNFT